tara:strand:+ start:1083 stop:1493 length:411 start_codon:yes stop_codon:yes gene_type:complete
MINTLTDTLKNILGFTKQKEVKCTIDDLEAPLFECGPGHFSHGYSPYVGIPAPKVLKNDPWFGEPVKSEKQLEYEHINDDPHDGWWLCPEWQDPKEPDNIHEVMYDMATKCGKTTTQLDPVGGSENFQGGSENIHG